MIWVHKCVFYCRTYSADHYLQEAKKLKHNADALVSKSAVFIQCLHVVLGFVLLLPCCCLSVLELSGISSQYFPFFFPILSVWQVWEGCVLPRCSGVVHWVWECIGEKCSGIQVPVPYVFRNCGINQVSTVGHIQNSNGWGRGLEIRASTFYWCSATNCWPPVLSTKNGSLAPLLQLLKLKVCSCRLRSFVSKFLML